MEQDTPNKEIAMDTGVVEQKEPVQVPEIHQGSVGTMDSQPQTELKRAREDTGENAQPTKKPKPEFPILPPLPFPDSALGDPITIPTIPQKDVDMKPETRDYSNILNFDQLDKNKETYSNGTPFPHVIIPNFLSSDEFIEELREHLNNEEWFQLKTDVLDLEQTQNLRTSQQEAIVQFQKQFYSPRIRNFVSSLVKFKIQANIDCIGEIYKQGSRQICRNSRMTQRRVCFFLFLSPETWKAEDGGSLNLYTLGTRGEPEKIGKTILPTPNTLVIFETTPNIFYEVSEVFAKEKELLLISGFFRSANKAKVKNFPDQAAKATSVERIDIDLSEWIDSPYFNPENQKKLRYQFERHNFVGLESFLKKEKYDVLANCIMGEQLKWKTLGPPNRRHYQSLDRWNKDYQVPDELKEFGKVISSKNFLEFLHLVTNQTPYTLFPSEYRKFKSGDYTTTTDQKELYSTYVSNECLDLHLGFLPETVAWNDEYGGDMTYLDGEDELLSVIPSSNTLSLVLRDNQATRFVRYFEARSAGETYDIIKTYVVASKDHGEDGDYDSEELKQSDEDVEDDDMVEDGKGDDYY